VTGSTVTKYYGVYGAHGATGAQRVAVRTGSTLKYLLGDHLGSTSIVTNTSGIKVMETRYKPCLLRCTSEVLRKGEVRFATASQTLPTRYTYTGQSLTVTSLIIGPSLHDLYDPTNNASRNLGKRCCHFIC
jgi:hypothetical protein